MQAFDVVRPSAEEHHIVIPAQAATEGSPVGESIRSKMDPRLRGGDEFAAS